jgi:hypothetical protein
MSSSEMIDGPIVGRDFASGTQLAKFNAVDGANRPMARFISKTTALVGGLRGGPYADRAAVPIVDVGRRLRPHGGIAGAADDLFGLHSSKHVLVPSRSPWRRLDDFPSSYVLDPVDT